MMQSPPPYVPVVEYVLKALEHPPFMYVSKLVACCTMLFLTRENPELLKELCNKWALRFRQDRSKLIEYIRNRASYCVNSPNTSTELESSGRANSDEAPDAVDGESSNKDTQRNDDSEEEVFGGIRCCRPDTAVEHLLSILNTLLPMYFSWNWHRADYVIQINKEYEAYVREFILPVCAALAPEEGVDDEEHTPWLLPPHTYLDHPQNTSAFYTPTSGVGPFPSVKAGGSGGTPTNMKMTVVPPGAFTGAPTELEGLGYSTIQNHFNSTTAGRKSTDRHAGAATAPATPLRKFSPFHPAFSGGNAKDALPTQNSSQTFLTASFAAPAVAGAAAPNAAQQMAMSQASGSSTVSAPVMSPNIASAGVFNTAAVYGLHFLSLGTYCAALRHNTRGLVTVFHAKYSAKSNEVIEAFQKITARRLLNPMPTIAVVYAVAEPELSTLYKVGWFPTIVYTPPLSSQPSHKRSVGTHGVLQGQPEAGYSGRDHPVAAEKRGSELGRAHHAHSYHRSRQETKSRSVTQSQSVTLRPLSGSDSLLDVSTVPAGISAAEPAAATITSSATSSGDGAAQYEEEARAQWESPSCDAATPVTRRNSDASNSAPHVVVPLRALFAGKVGEVTGDGPAAAIAVPPSSSIAATPTHLNPTMVNRVDNSSLSSPSGVSGPLSSTAPMMPSPTELLFGISVGETTPVHYLHPMSSQQNANPQTNNSDHNTSSVGNCSLQSSADGSNVVPSAQHPPVHQPLLDLVQHDDHVIYPLRGDLTVPALVEWIGSRGASVPRLGKLKDASIRLKSIRQEEKFKRFRELHSAAVTLRRLQGQGQGDLSASGSEADSSPSSRASKTTGGKSAQRQPEQPLFVFLGGGMAAGKTTAVAALAKSSFWQSHKEHSVVVNADEFKLPLECELASAEAHQHSTRAAEKLLVKAVNQGRSIVLDGTMMWKPFVQQVVNMIRAAHLTLFKQGPGYDPKTKAEQYFIAIKKRQPALASPYKIIFLGITVDIETAVPRGFLRKFSTNRGVPISTQLRSFKLFSENFADYVTMMDETTLYNNNVFVDLKKGELPPVMAECSEKTGHKLQIDDEAAFQQFVKQQQINEDADNATEVYPASPVIPDISS